MTTISWFYFPLFSFPPLFTFLLCSLSSSLCLPFLLFIFLFCFHLAPLFLPSLSTFCHFFTGFLFLYFFTFSLVFPFVAFSYFPLLVFSFLLSILYFCSLLIFFLSLPDITYPGCNLQIILEWAWDQVIQIKQHLDQLCKSIIHVVQIYFAHFEKLHTLKNLKKNVVFVKCAIALVTTNNSNILFGKTS